MEGQNPNYDSARFTNINEIQSLLRYHKPYVTDCIGNIRICLHGSIRRHLTYILLRICYSIQCHITHFLHYAIA